MCIACANKTVIGVLKVVDIHVNTAQFHNSVMSLNAINQSNGHH